jgi:KaiC/GvpD/RAD55 family RecA-like ATPase
MKPADPLTTGLPANMDAERFVLGAVLLDGSRFSEVADLETDDFSLESNRRIFRRMKDLEGRREGIDRVTIAEELARHNELGPDGLSYLTSLDEGMPHLVHLDSYVRILRNKGALRRTILAAQTASSHLAQVEQLRVAFSEDRRKIRRVEDLESIFSKRAPLEYLVKPELPAKAIVCLTGDSESGKTTLACAWARQVLAQGHAVLILDRDKNPRDRICDRLERLGISSDGDRLRIWDCEQEEDAPQPDHPIIVDWVKRMVAETGKSVLVIADSLVSFFTEDEDENSAVDMRAVFDRCRILVKLGATVILIHHTNRNGEARGSSDFKPASDQAFLVSNSDRSGGRLLDLMTLKCEKSRYGLSGSLRYRYSEGQMLRVDDYAPIKTVSEQLQDLLKANPGILTGPFAELAQKRGLRRNRGREFLKDGVLKGTIQVEGKGRERHHFWVGASDKPDDFEAQRELYSNEQGP